MGKGKRGTAMDEALLKMLDTTPADQVARGLTDVMTAEALAVIEPPPTPFENIAALVERTTTLPENVRRVTRLLDFAPTDKRLLVQRVSSRRTQTPGGLIIPPSAQELDQFCEVIRVGPRVGKALFPGGEERRPRPGDWVFIWAGAGMKLDMHKDEFLVITEEEALGYVEVETSEGGAE